MGELSRAAERLGMYDRIALGGTSPRRRRYLFNSALSILHRMFNYSLKRCFAVVDKDLYVVACLESIFEEDFHVIHF